MPKALFGPSMTKPSRDKDGHVTFYVAGGVSDSGKTEIFRYYETPEGSNWT
jgi:hypothetical protein